MASIRKMKKLGLYKKPKVDKKTLQETRKLVQQANRRLTILRKNNENETWASKKLINRLDSKKLDALERTRKGKIVKKIRVPEDATNTELTAMQKAIKQFLSSKTSTKKGIEKTKKKTIKAIKRRLSDEQGRKVTDEDAEFYYDMLSSKDFDWFNDKIGASAMWSLIDDAIEQEDSANDWINRLEKYAMTMNDVDARERAMRLYEKYILG